MKISEINIIPIKPDNGLIGFASVVLDGLYLGSIGVYSRLDGSGYRITYPTKKVGGKDLNRDLSQEIEAAITGRARELFGLRKTKDVMKC